MKHLEDAARRAIQDAGRRHAAAAGVICLTTAADQISDDAMFGAENGAVVAFLQEMAARILEEATR